MLWSAAATATVTTTTINNYFWPLLKWPIWHDHPVTQRLPKEKPFMCFMPFLMPNLPWHSRYVGREWPKILLVDISVKCKKPLKPPVQDDHSKYQIGHQRTLSTTQQWHHTNSLLSTYRPNHDFKAVTYSMKLGIICKNSVFCASHDYPIISSNLVSFAKIF